LYTLKEHGAILGRVELVEVEHLVGLFEVLLLVVVEHAVELHFARAGERIGAMLLLRGIVGLVPLGGGGGGSGSGVLVGVALPLLLVVATAALLVFLGHGSGRLGGGRAARR